jgi:hypothetical protein
MDTLFGFKVIKTTFCSHSGEPCKAIRTFRERFFSTPWNPFCKTKTITPCVPDRIIRIDRINKKIYMHPAIWEEIKISPCFKEKGIDETNHKFDNISFVALSNV